MNFPPRPAPEESKDKKAKIAKRGVGDSAKEAPKERKQDVGSDDAVIRKEATR